MSSKILASLMLLMFALMGSRLVNADPVWIDVRSAIEHSVDSIEGDLRIAHSDVVEEVSRAFPDKDTEIQLYCRSGNRAGVAMTALQEAGYRNVSNAGGIEEARSARGIRN